MVFDLEERWKASRDATGVITMKDEPKTKVKKMSTTSGNYGSNYGMWQWTAGTWILREDHCNYGCHAVPPDGPGDYEGQIVVTACQLNV